MKRMIFFLALIPFGLISCISAPLTPSIRSEKPKEAYQEHLRELDKPYFYARTKPKDTLHSFSLVTIPPWLCLDSLPERQEGDFSGRRLQNAPVLIVGSFTRYS